MKSIDAGTTMVLGAGIGLMIGITYDNISIGTALGAILGAVLGGIVMKISKAGESNHTEA